MPGASDRDRQLATLAGSLAKTAAGGAHAVASVGCDVASIDRMQQALSRTPRLLERLFAPAERALSAPSLTARFAAKEALVKALDGLDALRLNEIEVRNDDSGRPFFARTEALDRALTAAGIDSVHLSMSHDAGVAMAFVVAERGVADRASDDTAAAKGVSA